MTDFPSRGTTTSGPGSLLRPASLARAAGFTLVEVVFVVLIAGILASMVVPLYAPGRWRADSAVTEVALSLNAAQRKAVLRQHDVMITFEIAVRRLRILEDTDNDGTADPQEPTRVLTLPETIGFGVDPAPPLPRGPGPISFADGSPTPTLTFHRNGSASTSGIVYLRPLEGSLSADAESTRALTVERATGEVRCYSYRTGDWEPSC